MRIISKAILLLLYSMNKGIIKSWIGVGGINHCNLPNNKKVRDQVTGVDLIAGANTGFVLGGSVKQALLLETHSCY